MKKTLLTIISILVFCVAFTQNTIYVDKNANGANNGSSWTNAFKEFADALVLANSDTTYDTILVAEGIYFPLYNINLETDSTLKTFLVKRGNIAILGGYASGGATRNISQYKTILDGNIGNPNDSTDNARCVVSIAPENIINHPIIHINNIVFEGFEIRNAYGAFTPGFKNPNYGLSNGFGSAIHSALAEIYIANCKIYNNYADTSIIDINGSGLLKFNNNEVFNNQVKWGRLFASMIVIELQITNNNIYNNRTNLGVQSLEVAGAGNVIVSNNKFKNNNSSVNSNNNIAIRFYQIDTLVYQNNILEGSGSCFSTFGMMEVKRSDINNNQFYNNKYTMYALALMSDTITFENNLIHNNFPIDTTLSTLMGIATNKIGFVNNTIANEKSFRLFEYYIADTNQFANRNNVIHGYTLYNANQEIANTPINFKNSYIQNITDTTNGNIDGTLDPMFINPDTNYLTANFKLLNCSPLINKGDTVGISQYVGTNDLAGDSRYKNAIDLGAYEYQNDITNPNYIATATLTTESNNNQALVEIRCEEDGWTYYAHPTNSDSIVMAVDWKNNPITVKQNAQLYINVDNSPIVKANNSNDSAMYLLPRSWRINLNGQTLTEPVSVRFFYSHSDSQAVANAAQAASQQLQGPILWVGMPTLFNSQNDFTYNTINNGNYNTLSGTVADINGIKYIEFSQVNNIQYGAGFINAIKANIGTEELNALLANIYPNPAKDYIQVNNIPVNSQLVVYNIQGQKQIETSINHIVQRINVSNLHAGSYIIEITTPQGYKATRLIVKQ